MAAKPKDEDEECEPEEHSDKLTMQLIRHLIRVSHRLTSVDLRPPISLRSTGSSISPGITTYSTAGIIATVCARCASKRFKSVGKQSTRNEKSHLHGHRGCPNLNRLKSFASIEQLAREYTRDQPKILRNDRPPARRIHQPSHLIPPCFLQRLQRLYSTSQQLFDNLSAQISAQIF